MAIYAKGIKDAGCIDPKQNARLDELESIVEEQKNLLQALQECCEKNTAKNNEQDNNIKALQPDVQLVSLGGEHIGYAHKEANVLYEVEIEGDE